MLELRITDVRSERYVELFVRQEVFPNRNQTRAEFPAEPPLVCDPGNVGAKLQVVFLQLGARIARAHHAETVDPLHQRGIAGVAVGSGEDRGHNAKEVIVPVTLARRDFGMVILEKSPDFAERREVADLDVRERGERRDTRTAVKLVVEIDNGFWTLDVRRFPDRFAVDQ